MGNGVSPAIWLAAFLVNWSIHAPLLVAAGIGCGNMFAAIIGAYLLQRIASFDRNLSQVKDVLALIVFGSLLNSIISASVGVTSLALGNLISPSDAVHTWGAWWLGDAIGSFVVATPILLFPQVWPKEIKLARVVELFLLIIAFVAYVMVIFFGVGVRNPVIFSVLRPHVIFPVLIWAALRFGPFAAAIGNLVLASVAVLASFFGTGQFEGVGLELNLLALQTFVGLSSSTITLLAVATAQVKTLRDEYRSVFELSTAGKSQCSPLGVFLRVNRKLCEITGYNQDELVGKSQFDITHPEDREEDVAKFQRMVNSQGAEYNTEKRIIKKNGEVAWLAVRAGMLRDYLGRPLRTTAVFLDVTTHRHYEEVLVSKERNATEASLAKSRFLSTVSHEIRNPVSAISGFSDLLTEPNLSASDRQNYASAIRENATLLTNIVRDFLDFARLEAGYFRVQLAPVLLSDVIDSVRALFSLEHNKAVALEILPEGSLPQTITSDPTRLRQILVNVVANAIKFTERGRVQVRIRCLLPKRPNDQQLLLFDVEDTGPGMTEEEAAGLFKPFQQVHRIASHHSGTGLGLVLSRQFARALGGDVALKSTTLGVGSVFTIAIPTGRACPTAPQTENNRHPSS